ncbi:uncharacterized protein Z520_00163 [Fonsecaea multimorphosa CBS 102226]|uniref:Cytochrome P450 monooxygenase n=1 Tax=Fonsecaea multimorphosa CBS 102226 TaxID=1442371 RepID=A0A0D2J280_9EURO|nr:uncharacterized protein Z520_00163 [Fonsecaea multimorphosa CBS 102226]KIY03472.1 hypothetical protein Z520_00163 [Fonsecaea multimorphosa CBS 102226]OAL32730.1 hypothetical protein AYO22_00204 [Fonsecaea multimorphosa]
MASAQVHQLLIDVKSCIQLARSVATALLVLAFVGLTVLFIYRLYFHPLARYPGPWYMKVTPLYDFYIGVRERRHLHFQYLHEKYGPVVRYSPNSLAFNEPQAFRDIYGFKRNFRKADATTVGASSDPDHRNTFSEPLTEKAMKKRRILSQGFSESALRDAEEFMIEKIDILCKQLISPSTEKAKDMSLWLNYLAYDIMGEVVFGKSFDMLTNPSLRYVLDLIDSMVFSTLLGGIVPWIYTSGLINILFPRLSRTRTKFIEYVSGVVANRIAAEDTPAAVGRRKDFFHHLLNAKDTETGKPLPIEFLFSEGVLLVVGGSDTSSTGMAATLFYLLKYPDAMAKLRHELDSKFSSVDEIKSGPQLTSCVYLRACVDEALRMAPPGPGILPRTALKGGETVNGEYIPEGIDVGVGWWALAYNGKYFPDPETFRPERYLASTDDEGAGAGADDDTTSTTASGPKDCYWAFSMGPRKCPGIKMAYLEIYLTIARLAYLFDMRPERPGEMDGNFELLDHFSKWEMVPLVSAEAIDEWPDVKKSGPTVSFTLRKGREL